MITEIKKIKVLEELTKSCIKSMMKLITSRDDSIKRTILEGVKIVEAEGNSQKKIETYEKIINDIMLSYEESTIPSEYN